MLRKIIKDTLNFRYKKTFNMELLFDKNFGQQAMLDFFQNIETYLDNSNTFFKNDFGDTTTVAKVKITDTHLVIKRYNIKNFYHGLKIQFRRSHAFRSFCHAHFLPEYGIQTIKPIAVLQKKWGPIYLQSYFISQYQEGLPGCQYFKDDSSCKTTWAETINDISILIKKMQKASIYHGDFHFGNLLIKNKKPLLLDFDRIRIVKNKKHFDRLHIKDLNNFNRYLKRNSLANEAFECFCDPSFVE